MFYQSETFSIDGQRREISVAGEAVPVEPKVFDLVDYLVRNRQRVVSKDELIDEIWSGRVISDATLSTCVKSARKAIGDDGKSQRLIKTLHRKGFRFVGPLQLVSDGSDPVPVLGSAIVAPPVPDLEQTGDTSGFEIDLSLPKRPSIAVLPLETFGIETTQDPLANGLVVDMTVRLARMRWMFVAARASATRFDTTEHDLQDIARMLGVRYLLHGSLRYSDGRMRLCVLLTDAVQGIDIWAETFDRRIDDLFEVQDEIADLVVAATESEIDLRERRAAMTTPVGSLDAWSAYHRANDLLYRFDPKSYEAAEQFLTHAAKLEPGCSRTAASQSFLYWQRAFLEASDCREDDIARALDYGKHSVALDPLNPHGHWALGRANLLNGNFSQMVGELTTATELNPSYANGFYSLAYGMMLENRCAEAFEPLARARRISPCDPMAFAFITLQSGLSTFCGDPATGAEWAARAVVQPGAHKHVLTVAAWVHEIAGRRADAERYIGTLMSRHPGYTAAEYFRAFPYRGDQRRQVETALADLGLSI